MPEGKRSIPYPRDDLKIAIPSGGGPCSEALGLLLAVGARDQHLVVGRPMVRVDADSALPPGWTKYCSGLVLSFSALSLSAASSDCRDFLHMSMTIAAAIRNSLDHSTTD
jgi:hypothetical protein